MDAQSSDDPAIRHVSDTAIWVAYYRAVESERPDALFNDKFAKRLVGTRGREIAENMKRTLRYTEWSVVIRTAIIDRLIQKYVADGVDAVVNLGAGLDTRPYRLDLPRSLHWIEVDYADVIEHKERILAAEEPRVDLERVKLDLSDRSRRQELFASLGERYTNALVLTEGVVPYLTEEQAATLAEDLHTEKHFAYWIAEWYRPDIYRYFRTNDRLEKMKNAPFQFFPEDWFGFFKVHGWRPLEINYLSDEGRKLKRPTPLPWWARIMLFFVGKETAEKRDRVTAYVVFAK